MERLTARRLIEPVGSGGRRYALAEHLKEHLDQTDLVTDQVDTPMPRLVTDQVGRPPGNLVTAQVHRPPADLSTAQVEPLTELSATHRKIMALCDAPRRLTEIMAALGATGRNHYPTATPGSADPRRRRRHDPPGPSLCADRRGRDAQDPPRGQRLTGWRAAGQLEFR